MGSLIRVFVTTKGVSYDKQVPHFNGPAVLDQDYLREQSWLEKIVGPEWYRLLRGVVTNPLSVAGLIIVHWFVFMAAFAPVLAPPPNPLWDTTLIPRDGFGPNLSRLGQHGTESAGNDSFLVHADLTVMRNGCTFEEQPAANTTFGMASFGAAARR